MYLEHNSLNIYVSERCSRQKLWIKWNTYFISNTIFTKAEVIQQLIYTMNTFLNFYNQSFFSAEFIGLPMYTNIYTYLIKTDFT
jgi:hypothetical protein